MTKDDDEFQLYPCFNIPMEAAMPCEIRRKHVENLSLSGIRKTKYSRIVEADESARERLEGTLHKDHGEHIAGKGINPLNHYNLVDTCIPMSKAMDILEATSSSGERMGQTREDTRVATDESQIQERCDR